MSCLITIGGAQGFGDGTGTNVSAVLLWGSAQGCTLVGVGVDLGTGTGIPAQAVPNSLGQWAAVLDLSAAQPVLTVPCSSNCTILATCGDGQNNCSASPYPFTLTCTGYPACPSGQVTASSPGPCDANGNQQVTITVTTESDPTQTLPAIVYLNYGDGTFEAILLLQSQPTVSVSHEYHAPSTAQLVHAGVSIVFPSGCRSVHLEYFRGVAFTIGPCGGPCQGVTNAMASVSSNCNPDGTTTVTLTADVTPGSSSPTIVQWNFGDGNSSQNAFVTSSAPLGPTTHDYPPGTYTATLDVASTANYSCATVTFTVPACPLTCCAVSIIPCTPQAVLAGAQITFTAIVTPGNCNCVVYWSVKDPSGVTTPLPPSSSAPYTTPPQNFAQVGQYTVTASIINATSCPNANPVASCDVVATDPNCPTPMIFQGSTPAVGQCDAQGNVTCTVTAVLSPQLGGSLSGVTGHWTYTDPLGSANTNPAQPPGSQSPDSSGKITQTFTVQGSGQTVQADFRVDNPSDCTAALSTQLTIPACFNCPAVVGLSASKPAGCADGQGTSSTVDFGASMNSVPGSGTYTWAFGDGQGASGTAPAQSHAYGASGPFTATVTFTPDNPGCGPSSATQSVSIPPCHPCPAGQHWDDAQSKCVSDAPQTGGGNGGFGWLCFVGRTLVAVLFGAAAALLALALCGPLFASAALTAAAISGAAGAALLAVWLAVPFCARPCAWGLLLAGETLVIAGWVMLAFATCCSLLVWAGLSAIVAGFLLLLLWKSRCQISWCNLWAEILTIMVGSVLAAFNILAAVPLVASCLSPFVSVVVALIIVVLTTVVGRCHASSPPP